MNQVKVNVENVLQSTIKSEVEHYQFNKSPSTLSVASSPNYSQMYKSSSQKAFQRKPSFKLLPRKQSVQKQHKNRPKICYISPQKSQLFKNILKIENQPKNLYYQSLISQSAFFGWRDQTQQPKQDNEYDSSKSIQEKHLQRQRLQYNKNYKKKQDLQKQGYRTPIKSKFVKKQCFSVLNGVKSQQHKRNTVQKDYLSQRQSYLQNKQHNSLAVGQQQIQKIKQNLKKPSQQTDPFTKDFCDLLQIQSQIESYGELPIFQKLQKQNQNHVQGTNFLKTPQQNNIQRTNLLQELQTQVYSLSQQLEQTLTLKKLLEQQNQQLNSSNHSLRQQILKKDQKVEHLQNSVSCLNSKMQSLSHQVFSSLSQIQALKQYLSKMEQQNYYLKQHFTMDNQMNENFKLKYYQLKHGEVKYLRVENDVIRKQLQDGKQHQKKADKLQKHNKKLLAKVKYLTSEFQLMDGEKSLYCQGTKKAARGKRVKQSVGNQKNIKLPLQRKSLNVEENNSKITKKFHYKSLLVCKSLEDQEDAQSYKQNQNDDSKEKKKSKKGIYQIQQAQQNEQIQNSSTIQNDTDSQLSFELSPDKKDILCQKQEQQDKNAQIQKQPFFYENCYNQNDILSVQIAKESSIR